MPKESVTLTNAFLRWRTSVASSIREKPNGTLLPHPLGVSPAVPMRFIHTKDGNTGLQSIPSIWSMSREHQEITSQARRLGMAARERGEVRFRAGLPSRCDESAASPLSSGTVGELLDMLCEEVEGCRQWTAAVLTRQVRETTAPFSTHCADMDGNEGDDEVDCDADILAGAASSVSAVLNHLRPLRWILFTLAIFARTEWSLYNSDKALDLVHRLMIENVPVEIVTSLALYVIDLIHYDGARNEWIERVNEWCQHRVEDPVHNKLRKCIYTVLHSLGTRKHVFPCHPLYEVNEAELLLVRQRIVANLRRRIHLDSQEEQRSFEASLCFRHACDAHREICADQKTVHSETKHRAPHAKNRLTSKSNALSPSCWIRAVLAEWRACRKDVLLTLQSCLTLPSHSEWALRKSKCAQFVALLAPQARQLRAMVEMDRTPFHSSLLEALLQRASDEKEKSTAVELVVFLIASNGTVALEELAGMLRVVRESESVEMALRGIPEDLSAYLVEVILGHILDPTQTKKKKKNNTNNNNNNNNSNKNNSSNKDDSVTLTGAQKQESAVISSCNSGGNGNENSNENDSRADNFCSSSNFSLLLTPLVEYLYRLHSTRILMHAESILHASPTSSNELRCVFFVLFVTSVPCRDPPTPQSPFPSFPLPFLSALIEHFAQSLLDALHMSLPRAQRPPPLWLRDALWRSFVPFAIWGLRQYRSACESTPPRVVDVCHALVLALSERWDYSIVPARRAWRRRRRRRQQQQQENPKQHAAVELSILHGDMDTEYSADADAACRVVSFASLLEAVLCAMCAVVTAVEVVLVDPLRSAESFSRTCSAVGITVPDIDNSASHRILSHLLRLAPRDHLMDAEAHAAVVRCLSLMRNGCTLWAEALLHYERAIGSKQCRTRAHVAHFAVISALRCVGDAPIARVWRCALTMRVIATARAAGHELRAPVLAACLYNFTTRMHLALSCENEMFRGAPWCDALQWYNAFLRDTPMSTAVLRELPQLQTACLRAMLSQGEWQRALRTPLLSKPFFAEKIEKRVELLLDICRRDRTQSCAVSEQALLHLGSFTHAKIATHAANSTAERHCETVAVDSRVSFEKNVDASGALPLFRPGPRCVPSVSLSCEREGAAALRDMLDRRRRQHLPLNVRVRERVSRAFPLMHDMVSPAEVIEREQARAQVDTCYANVLVPIRRLARVRAERQRDARRRRMGLKCVPTRNE